MVKENTAMNKSWWIKCISRVSIIILTISIIALSGGIMFLASEIDRVYKTIHRSSMLWTSMGNTIRHFAFLAFPQDYSILGEPCKTFGITPNFITKETSDNKILSYYYIEVYNCSDIETYNMCKEYYKGYGWTDLKSEEENTYAVFGIMNPKYANYEQMVNEAEKYRCSEGQIPPIPLFDIGRLYNHEHCERDSLFFDYTSVSGLYPNTNIMIALHSNINILKKNIPHKDYEPFGKKLRHGFSCGVAFYDEKRYVYYWALAW